MGILSYTYNAAKAALKGKGKVSPTIKSVKPNLTKSVKQTKIDEYRKRYTALDKAEGKLKTGKQMMKEGQKERKKLVGTKRAFQFKGGSYHAIKPGEKPEIKYKGLIKEQKATGGRVGRKFGSPKPKTNIEKIKETFSPKKNLSPKQMKIAKLAGNPNKIDAADLKKLRNR
jgi:hypothetical protein|tara:strand:- start:42 stop:554 length:513 start_codon:yes stop_codon:yes gene_type:complete